MKNVIVIAEAGVNHNGDVSLAKNLIDVAAYAGVDYVKFQSFKSDSLVTKDAKKAEYQISGTNNSVESQLQMLQRLELSVDQHIEIIDYCRERNVAFFSTAFDLDSLVMLKDLGLSMVKIPSGEITNLPYLRKAASLFSEVILSTGMSTMAEIQSAINVFYEAGIPRTNITILHCNTEYPTPMNDVNLHAMSFINKEFGVKVGYSDHTIGIEVPIAAVALGARVIEKHFTMSRQLPGPDHLTSLEPDELRSMVLAIRNIELAIGGSGIKEPTLSEIKNMAITRKSIIARTHIKCGEVFTENNIISKRPGTGISPMLWDEVIGKKAKRNFNADDFIEL